MPKTTFVVLSIIAALSWPAYGGGTPVFHLDFTSFADVSGNSLPIDVGDAVTLVPGGGPMLAGGGTLDSARWEGEEDETNQIIVFDHDLLDAVTVGAGSIVAWIKPDDGDEWNNIAKTPCEENIEPCDAFGQFAGIEFQASGPHAGVFGAVQGWETNVFGPDTPLGEGGETDTPTDIWTHAALTWNDQGDHTIYVNGEPGETVLGVGDFDFGDNITDDWTIGGDGLGVNPDNVDTTRYLRGELADFAIFNGELTQDEIKEIINSGIGTSSLEGDFDNSGALDLADVNILSVEIQSGNNAVAFDLDSDGNVTAADLNFWIKDLGRTWLGDVNLDGEFNSSDFVSVFQAGEYEDAVDGNSTWATGDWNADGDFTSGDFVVAFQDGGFEKGPLPAVNSVPEPNSIVLLLVGLLGMGLHRRNST